MTCAHCGRGVISNSRWRQAAPEARAEWKRENLARMVGRGLCTSCYPKHRDDYDRTNHRLEDVLEDWDMLADPLVPVRAEATRLAGQFGMNARRLENIIYAHIGSRYEAGWGERIKKAS